MSVIWGASYPTARGVFVLARRWFISADTARIHIQRILETPGGVRDSRPTFRDPDQRSRRFVPIGSSHRRHEQ